MVAELGTERGEVLDGRADVLEVRPEKGGPGWIVARQGAKSVLSTHNTQSVAVKRGKALAKRVKTELVVKSRGGKIRYKDSFGADSRKRRG